MDYEKKYKEALEKAEKNYRTAQDLCEGSQIGVECFKNTLTNIFPELKESEDERIKNFISNELMCLRAVECNSGGKDSDRYKELTSAITWVEKQDNHANFLNNIQIGDKVTRNRDGVLVNLSQLNRVARKDEKQGKNNMGILEDTKKKLENNLNKALERETPESWNKFLKKQGEQKSFARYKVGDTIYYDSFGRLVSFVIANIVEDGTCNPMYEDEDGNSVFQNDIIEQKPAWSEEDEVGLGDALLAIEQARTIAKDENDMGNLWYTERWLKSLKQRIGG